MRGATVEGLQQKVIAFRDERDWKPFHAPKDVALSLVLEATELLEKFQWKDAEASEFAARSPEAAEELADVLYWVLLFAHDNGIDLPAALDAKLAKNAEKYPVPKARGSAKKYTEL